MNSMDSDIKALQRTCSWSKDRGLKPLSAPSRCDMSARCVFTASAGVRNARKNALPARPALKHLHMLHSECCANVNDKVALSLLSLSLSCHAQTIKPAMKPAIWVPSSVTSNTHDINLFWRFRCNPLRSPISRGNLSTASSRQ